jgi:hypothetical protein
VYFKSFATKDEVLAYITQGKPEDCADRLESHFLQALGDGLDHNTAGEKALLLHAHLDHGQGRGADVDPSFPYNSPEEVRIDFLETLMSQNFDNRAEERVDLVIETFDRYLKWGVNLYFASHAAWIWAAEKWTAENVTDGSH